MRFAFLLSVCLLGLTATCAATSSIELTDEGTVIFSEVHGSIDTAIFVDLVGSSEPEIVLLDDSSVQVYTVFPNVLLAEWPLTGAMRCLAVLDMNSDGKPDIVALQVRYVYYSRHVDLVILDNASGFAAIDSILYPSMQDGIYYWIEPPLLTGLDVDNDGLRELVLSYDSLKYTITNFGDRLDGRSLVIEDLQNPLDMGLRKPIRSAVRIVSPDGDPAVLVDKRAVESSDIQVLKWLWIDSYIDQWCSADSAATLLADPHPSDVSCNFDHQPDDLRSERFMRTWGQLTGDSATVELVSTLSQYQHCEYFNGDSDVVLHLEADYLSLHRFTSGQPLQEFWTRDITGEDWRAFVYLPQFPGYFFAIVDDEFSQFRGGDGSLFQSTPNVPEGELYWTRPFADSLDRLIALDGNAISLYRPDIVTGAADGRPDGLPDQFRLSEPYPNPFNPSVSFSISLPLKSILDVRVYNLLGQEVDRIFTGTLPAGERTFVWDAGDRPSGVYFIKAATTEATLTKKAVLVK